MFPGRGGPRLAEWAAGCFSAGPLACPGSFELKQDFPGWRAQELTAEFPGALALAHIQNAKLNPGDRFGSGVAVDGEVRARFNCRVHGDAHAAERAIDDPPADELVGG